MHNRRAELQGIPQKYCKYSNPFYLDLFNLICDEICFNNRLIIGLFNQGFSKFHFTPMEVLAVIESIQKRVGGKFSPEEIESGILKDLITETDYDIIRVVCAYMKCAIYAFECAS